MRTNFLLVLAVIFFTVFASGCNMFRGAGKDIENAGKSVQKTVEHND